jgi:hypothetical protein
MLGATLNISGSASREFAAVQKSKSRMSTVEFVGMVGRSKSKARSPLTSSGSSIGVSERLVSTGVTDALIC